MLSHYACADVLFRWVLDKIDILEKGYIGACHKNLSFDYLKKMVLNLPKNKQLITDLEPMFQEIEQLQEEVKNADKLFNQYIQELGAEAIQN